MSRWRASPFRSHDRKALCDVAIVSCVSNRETTKDMRVYSRFDRTHCWRERRIRMMHEPGSVKLRWQHVAILALTGWLAACSTVDDIPATRRDVEGLDASGTAYRLLGDGIETACNIAPD